MAPLRRSLGKAASVESVYSAGATKLSNEADGMKDDLLAAYLICHYNWQIDFLRPTIEEIVAEYLKVHDPDPYAPVPIHIPFTAPKGKARIPPRPIPQSGKPNGNVNHFTFAMCPPQTSKANAKPNEAKPHRAQSPNTLQNCQTVFSYAPPHRTQAPNPTGPQSRMQIP